MLNLETKLIKAALNYGKQREKAHGTKTLKDRIRFVHAEIRLGMAAQAIYEKERHRVPKRKGKG